MTLSQFSKMMRPQIPEWQLRIMDKYYASDKCKAGIAREKGQTNVR